MSSKRYKDISLNVTSLYLKIVGFWLAENYVEERQRKFAMIYTVAAMIFAVIIELRDFYFSWGDFRASIYVACNIASIGMGLFKMLISFIHKADLFNLMRYAKKNFWHLNYDPYEQTIINTCKRTCTFLICMFNFFVQGTIASYVIQPVMANIGKNASDRILPFNLWLDAQIVTATPYFEIAFLIQLLSLYHVGVCYLCFDNFLCILNLHAASQFRILQYRMSKFYRAENSRKYSKSRGQESCDKNKYYSEFRKYVQQHQALIDYCKNLERVFTLIVLGQVLLFSLVICLDGYLILMDNAPKTQRLIFIFHITGCLAQLLMFTYSCDSLIRESSDISRAVYESLWTILPMDNDGRTVRKDMSFVILRSQSPCSLTAGGFFPVSLETFTMVLSSAVSYFTLLTQY